MFGDHYAWHLSSAVTPHQWKERSVAALALSAHLVAMDDNRKLLILFFPFYLLHNSAFQPVSSSSIKQKINPKITFQLTISYEEKKCSKNIHVCVSDAAVYVTISSSPLKQFIQSKLHVITPVIPVVVSSNQPRLEYLPGKYMKIGEVVKKHCQREENVQKNVS